MGMFRQRMESAAHHLTVRIAARYGHHFPMHIVVGFPRSGTTWFSEVLGDVLNLPHPIHYIFPLGFGSIVQTHAEPTRRIKEGFFVLRDGRDAYVSYYFSVLRHYKRGNGFVRSRFKKVFGDLPEGVDRGERLSAFLEDQFRHPVSTRSHWGAHTLGWKTMQEGNPRLVMVRYRDMVASPEATLQKCLKERFGEAVDEEVIQESVARQDFQRQSARKKSQHRTFLRKGVTGDWRIYYNREAREVFHHYAGEALLACGCESDSSWIDRS